MKKIPGFTLIELMVTIAIAAVLLALAAPSFHDFILLQRLKGVSSQMVTDMQFARSEAAAKNALVRVRFSDDPVKTCYVVYTSPAWNACDCRDTPICNPALAGQEIRTVNVMKADSVLLQSKVPRIFEVAYNPATGAIVVPPLFPAGPPVDQFVVDSCIGPPETINCEGLVKRLSLEIKLSGRPGLCSPPATSIGLPQCDVK